MIELMPNTTVSQVSRRLVSLRVEGGVTTLGRVLTLVIPCTLSGVEEAIEAANFASREHPMRVILIARSGSVILSRTSLSGDSSAPALLPREPRDGLDAEIRVGGDAGASEVIVLRPRGEVADSPDRLVSGLLLSDAPVVIWWSDIWPDQAAETPLGKLAQRRITDSGAFLDPSDRLRALAHDSQPGDTDLAWARVTLWRAQLAAALDNAPSCRITDVTVSGTPDSSSTTLLAAWLRLQLRVPVHRREMPFDAGVTWGIHSIVIHSSDGDISITRSHGTFVAIEQPGHPRLEVPLPRRPLQECLAEDLRLLRPDDLYRQVVTLGVPMLLGDPATAVLPVTEVLP
jgi:glucose-6-phosphate dehydrogenase assembly protein OpcA